MLHHPGFEFVYQPKYAAYLNLIEPWWKALSSLALKGRRFAASQEVVDAVEAATGASLVKVSLPYLAKFGNALSL